jgi:hypothetical protein
MATKAKRQTQKQKLFDAVTHAASCLKEAGDPLHGLGPSQQYADAFNRYSEALKALLVSVCPLHVSDWDWDGYEANFHFWWDFGTALAQPCTQYDYDTRFVQMKCASRLYPDRPLDEELSRLAAEAQHYAELRNAMGRWAADARRKSLASEGDAS